MEKISGKPICNISKPSSISSIVNKNIKMKEETLTSDESLGILSLVSINVSDLGITEYKPRVSKVTELPSKYFKHVSTTSDSINYTLPNESTINDSDIMSPLHNTSKPGSSFVFNSFEGSKNVEEPIETSQSSLHLDIITGKENVPPLSLICSSEGSNNSKFLSADESLSVTHIQRLIAQDHSTSQIINMLTNRPCKVSASNEVAASSSQMSTQLSPSNYTFDQSNQGTKQNVAEVPALVIKSPKQLSLPVSKTSSTKSIAVPTCALKMPKRLSLPVKITSSCTPEHSKQVIKEKVTEASSHAIRNPKRLSLPVKVTSSCTPEHSKQVTKQNVTEASSHAIRNPKRLSLPVKKTSTPKESNQGTKQNVAHRNPKRLSLPFQNTSSTPKSPAVKMSLPACSYAPKHSSPLADQACVRLPLSIAQTELIWGCVEVDRCTTRDFVIKNTSSRPLRLQATVSGEQYMLMTAERSKSETCNSIKISMQPHEAKYISVCFRPTGIGAATGVLLFRSLNHQETARENVWLYGYGGRDKISIENIPTDTNNKLSLSLGVLNNSNGIYKSFFIKNTGQLSIFVYIISESKEYCQVDVRPNMFILKSQEVARVTATYRPSQQDLRKLQHSTIITNIGSLKITSGAEATRGRLRGLCIRNEAFSSEISVKAHALIQKIHNENMPRDLIKFKEESYSSIDKLLKQLNEYEVLIKVEKKYEALIRPQCNCR